MNLNHQRFRIRSTGPVYCDSSSGALALGHYTKGEFSNEMLGPDR